jgi:hypothetical protein
MSKKTAQRLGVAPTITAELAEHLGDRGGGQGPARAASVFQRQVRQSLSRLQFNTGIGLFVYGRLATGHIRLSGNPADTDTVTITVTLPGASTIVQTLEFDGDSAITSGNVSVTIGGSAAATATNLATAITANFDSQELTGVVHGTDTTVVDVAVQQQDWALTLAEVDSGGNIVLQDNAEELASELQHLWQHSRTITAEDVTRGRVRVDTGLTTIRFSLFRVRTASNDNTEIAYNGTISTSGGVIEFDDNGGTDMAAANILDLLVLGVA